METELPAEEPVQRRKLAYLATDRNPEPQPEDADLHPWNPELPPPSQLDLRSLAALTTVSGLRGTLLVGAVHH